MTTVERQAEAHDAAVARLTSYDREQIQLDYLYAWLGKRGVICERRVMSTRHWMIYCRAYEVRNAAA